MNAPPSLAAYSGARVLVTGATGFIATSLVSALAAAGAQVHANARHAPRRQAPGPHHFYPADLADPIQCESLVRRVAPDYVFHLASHVSGTQDLPTVRATLSANLIATVNLLTALTEVGGARNVVIAGSCEEPRAFSHDAEQTWPASPYAAAKLGASAYAGFFRKSMGLPVSHARIFMGYGPGQMDHLKLVPYLALSLLKKVPPRLGSPERCVDFIFIDDIVSGLLALGLQPHVLTLDIGTGTLTRIRAVAELLRDLIDPAAELAFAPTPDRRNETSLVADAERSEAVSGWRARIAIEQGLRRTAHWYREQLPQFG